MKNEHCLPEEYTWRRLLTAIRCPWFLIAALIDMGSRVCHLSHLGSMTYFHWPLLFRIVLLPMDHVIQDRNLGSPELKGVMYFNEPHAMDLVVPVVPPCWSEVRGWDSHDSVERYRREKSDCKSKRPWKSSAEHVWESAALNSTLNCLLGIFLSDGKSMLRTSGDPESLGFCCTSLWLRCLWQLWMRFSQGWITLHWNSADRCDADVWSWHTSAALSLDFWICLIYTDALLPLGGAVAKTHILLFWIGSHEYPKDFHSTKPEYGERVRLASLDSLSQML